MIAKADEMENPNNQSKILFVQLNKIWPETKSTAPERKSAPEQDAG